MTYISRMPIIVPGEYTDNFAVLFKSGKKIQCHNLATAKTLVRKYEQRAKYVKRELFQRG